MGDRAVIVFETSDEKAYHGTSPAIYLHWQGANTLELLHECHEQMDGRTDVDYVSARFTQICANSEPAQNTGVGINSFNVDEAKADWFKESHGDNGIFVVDVKEYGNWKIRHYNEYYDELDDVYKKKTTFKQMEDGSFEKDIEQYVHEDNYFEEDDFGKSKIPVIKGER